MNYNEMAREYKITANELLKKIENLKNLLKEKILKKKVEKCNTKNGVNH